MSQPLFISLMVANTCLVLLVILYHTVYGRYTFYRFNRWLLFIGLCLSVSIPFLRLPFFERPAIVLYVTDQDSTPLIPDAFATQPLSSLSLIAAGLSVLLFTGMAWGCVRLLIRLYGIYRIHALSTATSHRGIVFREVSLPVAPFAFMGNIYLNPSTLNTEQLDAVLLHEQVHIRCGHSIDMLLTELVQIIFWYNPWMPLLRQAVTQNLEYLTDEVMITTVMDRTQYQYSLLHTATHNRYIHLTNAFLFTNLKNRLNMMNKNQTQSGFKLSYLLALPLLGATALISSAGFAQQQKIVIKQTQQAAPEQQADHSGKIIKPENTVTVKAGTDGKVQVTKHMLLETGAAQKHAQPETVNIAIKASDVAMEQGGAKVTAQQITVMPGTSGKEVQVTVTNDQQKEVKALIIIDDVIKENAALSDIDPTTIVSVQVLKDAASVEQYGDKARNGVIKIVTKNAK
ncbi:M56 family metallopeptidase [Edaphocola aurantiacus]|uniref:M56 family metallopeptidase n=1 Tax=Edaphocola aurantiacus TaxID=2601682 RepID=UPI001C9667BE|nr:M56 family metallopeptidase [Edaphocola aurantiacus]